MGEERSDGGAAVEKLLLAPPWLISADNTLGHRYRHILYGARPPPWVLLHFVCVAAGEHSRILPMRLFGRWHNRAVNAEAAPPPKPSWDRRTPRPREQRGGGRHPNKNTARATARRAS